MKKAYSGDSSRAKRLRVGFVPLIDCAPLVVAKEQGIFGDFGLEVTLIRQPGWASVRDKISSGELDATHALAGLAFATTLGIGCAPVPCISGLLLNTHGDGITLSQRWIDAGIDSAAALASALRRGAFESPPVLGVVHPVSTHHFLLREWLEAAGIRPAADVAIVTVPPQLMGRNLAAGHLDGFCVGEPWNTEAVLSGHGTCVATSAALSPLHPEKALVVRREFAERRSEEHARLTGALLEACRFCDVRENAERVARWLAGPEYVRLPESLLLRSLQGDALNANCGERLRLHRFFGEEVNRPSTEKANWLLNRMGAAGLLAGTLMGLPVCADVFQPEWHDRATEQMQPQQPETGEPGQRRGRKGHRSSGATGLRRPA
ncbi:MAG TPA: CmpA/NrtA family ABC transporter substrate-binding protein [Verrucomicrobiales bacterium]|nr:CmpA/NrtA family ABC transporter substrate-binding protein [Verrucomicrobiales bacterium]